MQNEATTSNTNFKVSTHISKKMQGREVKELSSLSLFLAAYFLERESGKERGKVRR